MSRADFRLPEQLKQDVTREAEAMGLDFSEYVRQTLVIRLAWTAAVKAVQSGADPDELLDPWSMFGKFQAIAEAAKNDDDPRRSGATSV